MQLSTERPFVVFEQTMEGLVRALRGRMTPRCRARLELAGLKLDEALLSEYPFEVWMACLQVAAQELWPDEPPERAFFLLGGAFIEGFRETFKGGIVLALIRAVGPRGAIHRATHNFRTGNNYTQARIREEGPTCLILWMNEVGPYPSFTQGLVQAALRASGVHPLVQILDYDGHGCTYRCSWTRR